MSEQTHTMKRPTIPVFLVFSRASAGLFYDSGCMLSGVRSIFPFWALLCAASASAQTLNVDDWNTYPRPDLTVVVSEHTLGPDLVEISLLDSEYPQEELRRRIEILCALTGEPARGLAVQKVRLGSRTNRALLKASFATNHIIRGDQGLIDLNPILRAFAGPSPEGQSTRSLILTISGIAPNERIVRRLDNEHVALTGRQMGQLEAVEYRAFIKTSDPEKINVPVDASAPLAANESSEPGKAPQPPIWIAIVLAVLSCAALGALVYSFVGRVRAKPGARKAPMRGRK